MKKIIDINPEDDDMIKCWKRGFKAGYNLAAGKAALKECRQEVLYLSGKVNKRRNKKRRKHVST